MEDLVDDQTDRTYTISETSAATGVSVDTLRYYERASVLPNIRRSSAGQRVYNTDDLGWIVFVRRLRATGMPIRQVRAYTHMVRAGDGTVAERREVLEGHRQNVAAARDELTTALEVLDRKIAHYEAAERGVDVSCSVDQLRHVNKLG